MNFSLYNIHLFQYHFISYLLLYNKLSPTSSSLKQVFIILPSFWKLRMQKQLQFSRSVVSEFFWPHGLQHARLPCPSSSPGACSNSCPSSWWCHPTILSSVISFSSHLQSSQHQGLFQWASSSHQVAKVLELQLQPQSFQWIFRIDFL